MKGRFISRQLSVAVAANATSDNVLAGTRFAPVQQASLLSIMAVGDAVGLEMTLTTGADAVTETFAISGANRYPETDKDYVLFNIPVAVNEQIILRFTNTTGATVNVVYRAELRPVTSRTRRFR